jgi:hypothetical protein
LTARLWSGLAAAIFVTLAAAAPLPVRGAHDPGTQVTVKEINYRGWPGAYRISNGIVDVVVVPSIGRIMEYQLSGLPDTNPIAAEATEVGKPYSPQLGWVDYGGDKLWPAPQSDWGKHGASSPGWPPDSNIGDGPYTATPIVNGVAITSPRSPGYAMTAQRQIMLTPGSSQVTITDIFSKSADAPPNKSGFPVAIWNNTRVRPDATVFAPLSPASKLSPRGFVAMQDSNPDGEPNWNWDNYMLSVVQTPVKSGKVGIDDVDGWIAALYDGNVLFSERCHYTPGGPYLDGNTNAQFYTKDKPAFIEMELFSRGVNLQAGDSMVRTNTWDLQRLPRTPVNRADARAMIRDAMTQAPD